MLKDMIRLSAALLIALPAALLAEAPSGTPGGDRPTEVAEPAGAQAAQQAPSDAPAAAPAAQETGDQSTGADANEIPAADFSARDKALAERVEARWAALIERDFAAAYQFTLPSYRQTHTLEQYMHRFGNAVKWLSVEVLNIRYDSPAVARVKLALEYDFVPVAGSQTERVVTGLDETWLERSGSWWYSVTK